MSARIVFNKPQSRAGRHVKPGNTVTLAFGRGVGKSWFVRRLCYLLISQWEWVERKTKDGTIRGVRIVFLLPTFKQFKDVHARALLNELEGAFAFLGAEVDRTTYTVTFPGGSTIQVFPATEHSGQRARGIRADVAVLDECDDIDTNVYDAVVRPWFTEPWSLKIRIASGTPKRGRHGLLYKLFEAGRRGQKIRGGDTAGLELDEIEALSSFYSVHATCLDAPGNVDQREVTAARLSMPPATFSREYLCDFDAGEGLVYPFDEGFHVREPPERGVIREFLVGMDHGWVDAGVMLRIGIQGHGRDATAWVLEEHYESEVPNHIWDKRAQAWNDAKFWPDPSRPDRINDLKRVGCRCGETDNDIHGGIARVADLLFRRHTENGEDWARLYVAPGCVNTIREFGLYRRKKRPDGTFDEDPQDKHNHCLEVGTLVTTARGLVPIERVTVADRVLTRRGFRDVVWSGQTGADRELWIVETTAGRVVGTPDHRIWTENRGWIRLDAVRYGDIVVSCQSTANQSPFGTTESCSGATRTPPMRTRRITGALSAVATCIARSGKLSADRSLPGFTSITLTRIRKTIRSATSSASPEKTTSLFTLASSARLAASNAVSMLQRSVLLQPLGTARRLVASGTLDAGKLSSVATRLARSSASSVAATFKQLSSRTPSSAQTPAGRPTEERRAPTANREAAGFAAPTLRATDTLTSELARGHVLASRSAERSGNVYDLTVDGEHEFFADGVLVHNSMDALRYAMVGRFGKPGMGKREELDHALPPGSADWPND